jgi:DNA-directed RNA polymerase subunit A"
MHMPQSVQTMVELQEITIVPKHILSPAKSSPIISLTQDSLVSGYLFTKKGTLLAEDKIFDILAFNDYFDQEKLGEPDEIRDGVKYYSSTKVFSQVLPPLSYDGAGGVIIRNGMMEKGQLTKRVLGGSNDSLIHNIYNMYGSKKCQEFLDDSQTLLTKWLTEHAFSIGLGDMIPPPTVRVASEYIIQKYVEKTRELVESARQGTYQTDLPAKYRREKFEDEMQGITARLSNEIKDMQKKYINPHENQLSTAVESGSKGVATNIIQIMSNIGQQSLWGKRIPESFTNRTLPHYHKHDVGAAAGGFVRNSFIDGGTPAEFYWQAMGGRVSMIDTAIKSVTPETPIIVLENGETKYVTIGEWIDKRLDESSKEVEHHVEREMELLKLKDEVAIPTTDEKGNVTWGTVTAITRHDPGKELYKIETQSGRDVIVTESKALLIWDHEKEEFHMKDTPLVRTGDFVPVTAELAEPTKLDNSFLGKSTDDIKEFLEEYFETDEFNAGDKLKCGDNKTDAIKFAMLFSRLGIFVEIFNDGTVIIPKHGTYQTSHNVVLDKIIAITLIDVKDYPKVYDLTIPSTLNFGLANGLQVVDTAESGYIQRRLIKAMEDNKVCYDGTVRNAANKIIQFTYGDDGFDTMRLEKQKLELMRHSDVEMVEKYQFDLENEKEMRVYMTDDAISRLKKTAGYEKKLEEEFNRLKEYRHELRTKYMANLDVMETTLWSPVNYWRLIPATIYQFRGESSERSDLTPIEVIEKIDELIAEILSYYTEKEYAMKLFIILTRTMLSSKVVIYEKKINSLILDSLIDKIKSKILQSFVRPGEMVGPLAAQSIGEPSTQMSISAHGSLLIVIMKKSGGTDIYKGPIGKFCDDLMEKHSKYTFNTGHEDSFETILENDENEYYIVGVNEDETTSLCKISHVSRHPSNGDLMEIKTRSGRSVITTYSHSHLTRTEDKVVPILGKDLKKGIRVPVAKNIKYDLPLIESVNIGKFEIKLDELFGWFIGAYLAEGCITKYTVKITSIQDIYQKNTDSIAKLFGKTATIKSYEGKYGPGVDTTINCKDLATFLNEKCGKGSFNKKVPNFAYASPPEFIRGLLRGYFDGDGNIQCSDSHHYLRACSRSEQLIKDLSTLYAYKGIFVGLTTEKNKHGSDLFHYTIPYKYAQQYYDEIGTDNKDKEDALIGLINYNIRTNGHSKPDYIDKIPNLGKIIAKCGKELKLPGQSRNYGRWAKKDSIGRDTLKRYIQIFEKANNENPIVTEEIAILKQAVDSDVIWDEIVEINNIPDPKEYVYDFTVPRNQTFMVEGGIVVHNTLNSVDWEEPIIIMRNGMTEDVRFGEFVDYMIENGSGRVDHLEHEQIYKDTMEDDLKVMAVDPEGIVRWRKIKAVTRHLPVNEDRTDTILEVKTESGRTVKATKAKSFLMRVDNKLAFVNGSDLKIGDRLPVSFVFPMNDIDELNEISIEQWFPKSEYIWGSEMKKAYDFSLTKRRWFKEHNGKDFTVPYKRSDTCLAGLKAKVQVYEEGFVYNRCCTGGKNSYGIPEKFELDNLFGFFIGAYLAEGLVTETYIAIANNDYGYLFRLIQFCKKYNLGFHLTRRHPRGKDGKKMGLSTDIRIHSTMLASFLLKTCGNGSQFKFVPNFAYIANKDFIKGLLDGYYSGDGYVTTKNTISCSSVSEALIDGMINLLARFDIFSKKNKPKKIETNNKGSLDIKQHYTLIISSNNIIKFVENISLIIPEKQDRLNVFLSKEYKAKYTIGRNDIIPSVKIGEIEGDIHRDELKKIAEFVEDEEEKTEIIKAISQNVYYDPIVSIKEVSPTHRHVYDFTVEKDFTFLTRNSLCMVDTFHLSGVAGKSAVTSTGVPRLREIINLAKTIDKPNMTVALKEEYRYNRDKAEELRESLEYTKIEDIIQETMIMYENDVLDVTHDEDQEFIRVYHEFSDILGIDDLDEYSKWTLRLVFDKEKMLNKNIYMQDVQDSILNTCDNQGLIKTVFSDDNSGNLVLRLSVKHDSDGEGEYMELLKSLEECILNITLRGLSGIEQVTMAQDNRVVYNEDGSYETKKIWEIYTAGTNLNSILAYDMVDPYTTISNDFYEIQEIFGIEGVRTVLMRELTEMLGDKSEYSVNYRHIKLLVDTMTYRGVMMAIGRHGINRNKDNSVLTKASFEETTEIFINAGTFGEKDDMQGISGNVIMGQFANMGTNMFDIYLDEDMLGEHYVDNGDEDEDEDYDPYELESEIDNMDTDNVTDDDFNFGFTVDPNNQYTLPNVEIGGYEMQLDIDGKVENIKLEVIEEEEEEDSEPEINSDSDSDSEEEGEDSEPEINSDSEEEEGGEPNVDSDREEETEHKDAVVIEDEEEDSEPEISDSDSEEEDEFDFTENVD